MAEFYPAQELSNPKSKLALCWLAGTTNEQLFKKRYSSVAIKKLNVVETCDEILQATHMHNGKRKRFSLYLSSQLMYGATKILSYQTKYLEKELLEIEKILNSTALSERSVENFDTVRALDSPSITLPSVNRKLIDLQIDQDLHILPGEIPNGRLQVHMQDAMCLNFGALTDEEMDFLLERDGDISLRQREEVQIMDNTRQRNAVESTVNVVEITEEVHREMMSPRTFPSPALIDVSEIKDKSKEKLLSTPQKRQPRQPQLETPTKRRRLSLEEATAVALDPAPMEVEPLPESHAQDTLAPTITLSVNEMTEISVPFHDTNIDMELQSICSSFDRFIIQKKPKIIDKKTELDAETMKKQLQDVKIHCRQLSIPQIPPLVPATNLFNQPSKNQVKQQWGSSLRHLFSMHIKSRAKPFKKTDEDVAPVTRAEFIQSQEEIRGLQRTVDDYTGQTTSKLVDIDEQVPVEEFSAAAIQELHINNKILHHGTKIDVNSTNDTLEDIEILLEKQQMPLRTKDQISRSSTCSTEKSQTPPLTDHEILAMLEVSWLNEPNPIIKFNKFLSNEGYTKQDVATVFLILLEFHMQKKVLLTQDALYKTLWIQKYQTD